MGACQKFCGNGDFEAKVLTTSALPTVSDSHKEWQTAATPVSVFDQHPPFSTDLFQAEPDQSADGIIIFHEPLERC